jgi:hypothetical protein
LIQFHRIPLAPNETFQNTFTLVLNQELSTFGLSPGDYEIQIGGSSKDIRALIRFKISE